MTGGYYQRLRDEAIAAAGWPVLKAKLLAAAPGRVIPWPEPHMAELLERGALVSGRVLVRSGIPNRCHFNASLQWLRDPRALIYVGYAYDPDHGGLWRQHSWNGRKADIIDMHDSIAMRFGVMPDQARFVFNTFTGEFDFRNLDPKALERAVGPLAYRRLIDVLRVCVRRGAFNSSM